MKTSTLSLLTAFVSAALVSLVGAQETKPSATDDQQPSDKSSERSDKTDQAGKEKDLTPATQAEFIKTAARKGMGEVMCARIALAKSENPKVRELAEMLVKDHTAANEELKAIAEKLDITLATDVGENVRKKHAELEKKTGMEFDTAFLNGMATAHRKGIALFGEGAKVSKSEPVLTFVEKVLPTLRNHSNKIKELGGVDDELVPVSGKQVEAPRAPTVPATDIPGPR